MGFLNHNKFCGYVKTQKEFVFDISSLSKKIVNANW